MSFHFRLVKMLFDFKLQNQFVSASFILTHNYFTCITFCMCILFLYVLWNVVDITAIKCTEEKKTTAEIQLISLFSDINNMTPKKEVRTRKYYLFFGEFQNSSFWQWNLNGLTFEMYPPWISNRSMNESFKFEGHSSINQNSLHS